MHTRFFPRKETYSPFLVIFLSNCTGSFGSRHSPLSRCSAAASTHLERLLSLTLCVGPTSLSKIVLRPAVHLHPPAWLHEYYVLQKKRNGFLSQKTKEHLKRFWKLLFRRQGSTTGLSLLWLPKIMRYISRIQGVLCCLLYDQSTSQHGEAIFSYTP